MCCESVLGSLSPLGEVFIYYIRGKNTLLLRAIYNVHVPTVRLNAEYTKCLLTQWLSPSTQPSRDCYSRLWGDVTTPTSHSIADVVQSCAFS